MINEHERIVLTTDIPEAGLKAGYVGTVVHRYNEGLAYKVDSVTLEGKTAAVVTVEASQVRPVGTHEITHARELGPTSR